jgi:hypothetical protein
MAGRDKSTQRVIAVIALMTLAAWALRGHVPGTAPPAQRQPPPADNPVALFAVVGLVCAAVAVIAVAIVARLRDRRPRRPTGDELPRAARASGPLTWRYALVALALIIGWLALVMLLMQIEGPGALEQSAPRTGPTTSAQPSPDPARAADQAPSEPRGQSRVAEYLIPPMLVLMTVVVVGTAVASGRQRRRTPEQPAEEAELRAPRVAADSLVRAAEVGLAEIGDLTREPREAIIACYAAMERELTRVPGAAPQDCDTPTEVLGRAVARGALHADSATELVELFEEARFSPHVMTEAHRDAAVRVLERVLAELPQRSDA